MSNDTIPPSHHGVNDTKPEDLSSKTNNWTKKVLESANYYQFSKKH